MSWESAIPRRWIRERDIQTGSNPAGVGFVFIVNRVAGI